MISMIADLATIAGVIFATFQVMSWRRQQNSLKAQNLSDDLLKRMVRLKRQFDNLAKLGRLGFEDSFDRNDGSAEDFFASKLERSEDAIAATNENLDEVEVLVESLSALDATVSKTSFDGMRAAISQVEYNIECLVFWRDLKTQNPDVEFLARYRQLCEDAQKTLLALSEESNSTVRVSLKQLTELAKSKMSLKGGTQ